MATETVSHVWSFGIGSNMNVELVENKKKIKVLEHACAVLTGWRLGFTLHGMEKVEPSFADAQPAAETDSIHGVVLKLSQADAQAMDNQEGYNPDGKTGVVNTLQWTKKQTHANQLSGFPWVYTSRLPKVERACSKRYLSILTSGAKDAGLNEAYIARLAARPTYTPDKATLERRLQLPEPTSLPAMTVAELEATKAPTQEEVAGGKALVGTMWYVSTTGGISMDTADDFGRPPFRVISDMADEEAEYVRMWRDHYLDKCGIEGIVAYLSEFLEESTSKAAAGAESVSKAAANSTSTAN